MKLTTKKQMTKKSMKSKDISSERINETDNVLASLSKKH